MFHLKDNAWKQRNVCDKNLFSVRNFAFHVICMRAKKLTKLLRIMVWYFSVGRKNHVNNWWEAWKAEFFCALNLKPIKMLLTPLCVWAPHLVAVTLKHITTLFILFGGVYDVENLNYTIFVTHLHHGTYALFKLRWVAHSWTKNVRHL